MPAGAMLSLPRKMVFRAVVGRLFHRYFTAVPANSDELRESVYRIRYEVYCRELGWEDPENFPDAKESDEYDADSSHVLIAHKPSASYAGTVRLVRTPKERADRPLPFELGCAETLYPQARELLQTKRTSTGEISRLAVPAKFRRRLGEQAPVGDDGTTHSASNHRERRRTPPIAMSLYLAAASIGLDAGLESVFALMEPRLAARLNRYGIKFRQMGEPIEHRGQRAPFIITREDLFAGIEPKALALLQVIQGDLRKHSKITTRSALEIA